MKKNGVVYLSIATITFVAFSCFSVSIFAGNSVSDDELWAFINRVVFVHSGKHDAETNIHEMRLFKFDGKITAYVEGGDAKKEISISALNEIARDGDVDIEIGDSDEWNILTVFTDDIGVEISDRFRPLFMSIYNNRNMVDDLVRSSQNRSNNCYSHAVTRSGRIYHGFLFVNNRLSGQDLSKCLYKNYLIMLGFFGGGDPVSNLNSVVSDNGRIFRMTSMDKFTLKFIYRDELQYNDSVEKVKSFFISHFDVN